jgi:hypothetical protein
MPYLYVAILTIFVLWVSQWAWSHRRVVNPIVFLVLLPWVILLIIVALLLPKGYEPPLLHFPAPTPEELKQAGEDAMNVARGLHF